MSKERSVWGFFIDNYKFTLIITAAIVVFGLVAAIQMPKESQPEVDIPIGFVTTFFPGASVEDVEELVTNKIEDRLTGLNNVKQITSGSSQGLSTVVVEFTADSDSDKMIEALKDKVDLAKLDLPAQAEDPSVTKVSFEDTPFVTLVMSGPFDAAQLTAYADDLKNELERIPGISTVQLLGAKEAEIQIVVDKAKLDGFNFEISQITQAISQANSDIPIGSIETAGEQYSLRFAGRLEGVESLANIPVGTVNGVPVLVRDVGTVIDGYKKSTSITKLSTDLNTSNPAVSLRLFKAIGSDLVRVSDAALKRVDEVKKDQLPASIEVRTVDNLAEYIRSDLNGLFSDGWTGVLIVVVLLSVAIGWREALTAGISVPLSFMLTLIWLDTIGVTLNFMTLFSLILALGILVDSAIVINEGINKAVKTGMSIKEASMSVIKEFQYPIISGTLVTVFAFVPMLLAGGIVGQFIRTIPITVNIVLISSVFVALGIVPALTVVLSRLGKTTQSSGRKTVIQHIDAFFDKINIGRFFDTIRVKYSDFIGSILSEKPKRKRIIRYLVLAFIVSYSLPFMGLLRIELFPQEDQDAFAIELERPFGTPLEETAKSMEALEKEIYGDDRVESFVVSIGSGANLGSQAGGSQGSHLGNILINLKKDRKEKSYDIVESYQKKLANFDHGTVSISQGNYGPGSAAPVEVTISGEDLDTLDTLAGEFKQLVIQIPGTVNVDTSVVQTNGQFVVYVDRIRAQQYGVNASQLAFVLRNAINGSTATEISEYGEDVDVIVKYGLTPEAFLPDANLALTDLSTIESLTILTPQGDIPLSQLADIRLENSRASVSHEDGERVVKVTSHVTSQTTAYEVFRIIEEKMSSINIPDGYTVSLGGEDEDTQESFNDMYRAMILGIVLIAALMVLQFKSFKDSLIVVSTLPLALIGVFPGLFIMNLPLSFPGIIGVVSLAGIVVNNAIILIDKINNGRNDGLTIREAIITAARTRIEPIILTTVLTLLSILPLAITEPVWSSLGFVIVYGLLFSTILTLVILPMMYQRLHRKEESST